ncbi:MAG: thymidylate kinase [Planctomycetota bacterium]|jgi:thymidylate kinase
MSGLTLFDAFQAFLHGAAEAGIAFAQIRHRDVTEEIALSPGDYDFFVDEKDIEAFLAHLHKRAAANCLPLLICRQKREKAKVTLFSRDGADSILMDLWIRLEVKDPKRRSRRHIMARDIVPHLEVRDGVMYLAPRIEALFYISHLFTKSKDLRAVQVRERLGHYAQTMVDQPDIRDLFDRLIQGGELESAAAEANGRLVCMGILRPRLSGPHAGKDLATYLGDRLYKLRRKLVAKRKFIAVVGPDGVGKTTLIQAACSCLAKGGRDFRFKKLYRHATLYKLLFPGLRRKYNRAAGMALEKNQIDDKAGSFIFWMAWYRYFLLALLRLRKPLTLVDRYYFELLIQDLRFQEKLPTLRPRWRSMLNRVPMPRMVLHLDAPNEVIASRNEELRSEGVDAYRTQMFAMAQKRGVPFYLYLNTSNSVEQCKATFRKALCELKIPITPPGDPE